jgi:hypothetical protein
VDMLGIMANLGVDCACYWAFHNAYPPRGGDFGVLSSEGSNTPYYSYYAHVMMTNHLKNKMVKCSSNDSLLASYASIDKTANKISVILVNKDKNNKKTVELNFKDVSIKSAAKGWILNNDNKYIQINDLQLKENRIDVPPYSAIVLELENKDYKPEPENLAFDANISASSYSLSFPYFQPKYANDGLMYTRWASASWVSKDGTDAQWFNIEFKTPKTFNTIKIFWDNGYGINYDILISDDGKQWKKILSIENGKGKTEEIKFEPVSAEFIKLDLKKGKKAISTYNIKEIEVYNTKN